MQFETLKAAKDDRFAIIKQTKAGEKVTAKKGEGLTTVSQAGQTSKFKSCFGEPKELVQRKAYVPSGLSRKKPTSYFNAKKRSSVNST